MRYALTGATGFVGGHLAAQLRRAGHDVVAVVRSPEKAGALFDLGVEVVPGDVTSRSSLIEAFRGSGVFALNLLPLDAAELCRRFSSRAPDRFAGVAHRRGPLGLPLLDGMLAHLCCRIWARYPGGDHEILVGEVLHAQYHEGEPLVFHQGQLARLDSGAG